MFYSRDGGQTQTCMNRIFKIQGVRTASGEKHLLDMTATARTCGHRIPLKIETNFVCQYYVPTNPDDDGQGLVNALMADLQSALAEELPSVRISHGTWLSVYLDFLAQRRNRLLPETLPLRYLLGPCDANSPSIVITCEQPPLRDEHMPF